MSGRMSARQDRKVAVPGRPPSSALAKTLTLAVALSALALVVAATKFSQWNEPTSPRLTWWMLAIGFALGEILVFHIEVRREAITFPLSELPLLLGLFFASPYALLVGRVLGSLLVVVFHERQSPRKVVLNLATFLIDGTTAVVVFHSLSSSGQVLHPGSWMAAWAAVIAAGSVSFIVVTLAMHWHGAPLALTSMIIATSVTAVTNTALGVVAAVLLASHPFALIPLCLISATVVVAYRGYASLRQRYSSLRLLYEFTRLVSGAKRPDDVLASMLGEARELLRAERAAIVVNGPEGALARWLDDDTNRPETSLPIDQLCQLVSAGRAVVMSRSGTNPLHRSLLKTLGAKDGIVAPLLEGTAAIGVLLVVDRETDVSTFDNEDGRLFETLANHAGVALENGRLIDRLHEHARQREREALHDSLTGLPNRAHFRQELTRAIVESPDGAGIRVALLDINHFKEVNDTLGHHHGDLLLQEVSRRIRAALPSAALLARLGGDEFAIFAPATKAEPEELGRIVHSAFALPFVLDGLAVEIGGSIGIALCPDHGSDPTTLLQRADVAMYDAKTSSSDHVEVYSPKRDVHTHRRLGLANDLRHAINAGGLELYFQPKARLADGFVHSVEGLIRWRHIEFGMVPPDEFVPLIERTGLIQPFTHFVVEQGLDHLRQWTLDGYDLNLSMNLSMRNLLDTSLPGRIERMIDANHVDPARVCFEVTETSMMADPTKVHKTLTGLADLGVRLAIDDFGSGHSSLSYLQRLPVHEVKLDRSFIVQLLAAPATRAIVQSVVDLGHSLDLTVVAEGVEDQETWDMLQALGCDDVQGYHLCRPLPNVEMITWLNARMTELKAGRRALQIVHTTHLA